MHAYVCVPVSACVLGHCQSERSVRGPLCVYVLWHGCVGALDGVHVSGAYVPASVVSFWHQRASEASAQTYG